MEALGLIEVYGYIPAVEALDSALKAANVRAVSMQRVTGGLVTVIFTGDVGAVKVAVDVSAAAAACVGRVLSAHVIPRPDSSISDMLYSSEGDATDERQAEPTESTATKRQSSGKRQALSRAEKRSSQPAERVAEAMNADISDKSLTDEVGAVHAEPHKNEDTAEEGVQG